MKDSKHLYQQNNELINFDLINQIDYNITDYLIEIIEPQSITTAPTGVVSDEPQLEAAPAEGKNWFSAPEIDLSGSEIEAIEGQAVRRGIVLPGDELRPGADKDNDATVVDGYPVSGTDQIQGISSKLPYRTDLVGSGEFDFDKLRGSPDHFIYGDDGDQRRCDVSPKDAVVLIVRVRPI